MVHWNDEVKLLGVNIQCDHIEAIRPKTVLVKKQEKSCLVESIVSTL